MKKCTLKMKKKEDLGLTITIEVERCPRLAVCGNMYGKADYTIYKEHNWN